MKIMANPGTELAALDFGNLIGGPLNAVITAQSMAAQSTADFIKSVGFYPDGTEVNGVDVGNTPVYVDFKYPKEIMPYQPGKTFLKVFAIEIVDGGSGYTAAPTITFSTPAEGETGATATATITAGVISAINITAGGIYLNPPTVTITPPPASTEEAPSSIPQVSVKTSIDHVDNAVAAVYQDMKISVPILTMLPIPFIKVDIITIDFNAKITSMETQNQSSELAVGVSLQVKQRWPGGSAKLNASVAYKKSTSSGSSVERTYSMAIHVQASQDEMPAGMEKLLGILEGAIISTPAAITT
jgi:hypothetical protein